MIDFDAEVLKFCREHAMLKPTPLVIAAFSCGMELAYGDSTGRLHEELKLMQKERVNGTCNHGRKSGTIPALEIPSSV